MDFPSICFKKCMKNVFLQSGNSIVIIIPCHVILLSFWHFFSANFPLVFPPFKKQLKRITKHRKQTTIFFRYFFNNTTTKQCSDIDNRSGLCNESTVFLCFPFDGDICEIIKFLVRLKLSRWISVKKNKFEISSEILNEKNLPRILN